MHILELYIGKGEMQNQLTTCYSTCEALAGPARVPVRCPVSGQFVIFSIDWFLWPYRKLKFKDSPKVFSINKQQVIKNQTIAKTISSNLFIFAEFRELFIKNNSLKEFLVCHMFSELKF